MPLEPRKVSSLGLPIVETKSSKLSALESEIASHVHYRPFEGRGYHCLRCGVSWPCLGVQLAIIDKMRISRDDLWGA